MSNLETALAIINEHNSKETAIPIMCVLNEYLFLNFLVNTGKYATNSHRNNHYNGKYYDIHALKEIETGKDHELFFDVTGFYGKGEIIHNSRQLPPPKIPMLITDFFQNDGTIIEDVAKSVGVDLSQTTISFATYSSDQVFQKVCCIDPVETNIKITPLRKYFTDTIPILHGYYFYRLMFDHFIQHIIDRYDFKRTETPFRSTHDKPIMGIDCIKFTPLPEYNYVNDLINYTFYNHKPGSFAERNELRAFASSLHFGFSKGLFTLEEIISAIETSSPIDENPALIIEWASKAYKDIS